MRPGRFGPGVGLASGLLCRGAGGGVSPKHPERGVEVLLALFQDPADLARIHAERAGDRCNRFPAVMGAGENLPVEIGPLAEDIGNSPEEFVVFAFSDNGRHGGCPNR